MVDILDLSVIATAKEKRVLNENLNNCASYAAF
jgi:hypothetical protein